jgi:hypothetical protein
MGYLHISNLYADTTILQFKECYALEKIHGTSAHVAWKDNKISYFAGGSNHESFVALFDETLLVEKLMALYMDVDMIIFGEAYGGKLQRMSKTYGPNLKFIAFDVRINDLWLDVPSAEHITLELGLEFVAWTKITTDLEVIDGMRDAPSIQAQRNLGVIDISKVREGIVLRPLIELRKNNGERIIAKHKGAAFQETNTPREVDTEKVFQLQEATAAAEEWVTEMRLTHVLDKFPEPEIENTRDVIRAMMEDIYREGAKEVKDNKQTRVAIGHRTAKLFKERLNGNLRM